LNNIIFLPKTVKVGYRRMKEEEIINVCNKFELEWVGGEFSNIYSKLTCKDKYGYLYDNVTLNGLLSNNTPLKYHKKNTYSLYNLNLYFNLYHPDIELQTEIYENIDEKLKCRCRICNNVWTPTYNSIKVGKGCPECSNKKRTGALTITLARRNKTKFININAKIYVIKCSNQDEIFYKIGITTKNISDRFLNKGVIPYSYEILYEINTNLYEAIFIEKELHYNNKEFTYRPIIKFDGYTECFSKINVDKILITKNNMENYEFDITYKTNCHIDIDNTVEDIRWLTKDQLIYILVKLNSYAKSAKELEIDFVISGYHITEWITDIKSKLDFVSRKEEENKLKVMESKLHQLLSNEKKVELEIDEIMKNL